MKLFQKIRNLFTRKVNYKLRKIIPYGTPTYDPCCGMVNVTGDAAAYGALVVERGEVIEPFPYETAIDIAAFISQRAADREWPRIIVYPVEEKMKEEILKLLENREVYPLLDYFPAMMVGTNGDTLNTKSIIFKYKKLYDTKPI